MHLREKSKNPPLNPTCGQAKLSEARLIATEEEAIFVDGAKQIVVYGCLGFSQVYIIFFIPKISLVADFCSRVF